LFDCGRSFVVVVTRLLRLRCYIAGYAHVCVYLCPVYTRWICCWRLYVHVAGCSLLIAGYGYAFGWFGYLYCLWLVVTVTRIGYGCCPLWLPFTVVAVVRSGWLVMRLVGLRLRLRIYVAHVCWMRLRFVDFVPVALPFGCRYTVTVGCCGCLVTVAVVWLPYVYVTLRYALLVDCVVTFAFDLFPVVY